MPSTITYHDILAAAGLRVNALVGTDPSELEVTYSKRPLVAADFESSIIPFDAFKFTILNTEQRLSTAIADTGNHPWRANLISLTKPLFCGEDMPADDLNGKPIIGIYGAVVDADNPTLICTEPDIQPVETIRRWMLNKNLWIMPLFAYSMDGNGIIHTRNQVQVQCCVYDYAAQSEAFDANEPILLPDVLAPAYIAGTVAGLVRDDEFMAQSQLYAQFYAATEQMIRSGLTSISQVALPGPSLQPAAA